MNLGPLAPKSDTLTTRLCRKRIREILCWLLVPLLWLYLKKQPLRLSMASEVAVDLRNEFRDLDYIYSGAYILSLSLKRLFSPGGGGDKDDL